MSRYTFDVPTVVTVYVDGDLTPEEAADRVAAAFLEGVTLDHTATPGMVLHQVGLLDGHHAVMIDGD